MSGLKKAGKQMDQAAADVVQHGAQAGNAYRLNISSDARQQVTAERAEPPSGERELQSVDLPEALQDARLAKHLNAANVKVLNTAEEMSKELLGMKA